MRYFLIILIAQILLGVSVKAETPNLYSDLFKIKEQIHQDNYVQAQRLLSEVEEECLKSSNDTIQLLYNESKGQILFSLGNYKDCLPLFSKVCEIYEKINLKDIDYIESFLVLGVSNQRLGNLDDAERYYRTGLLKTVCIPQAADYQSHFYLNLGDLYKLRGDSVLSKECYKRIDARRFGELIDGNAEDLINEEELKILELRKAGEYEQAVNAYESLIARTKEIIGTNNEDYARLVYSKALVLSFNLGQKSEAKPLFLEVMDLSPFLDKYDENVLGSTIRYAQVLAFEGNEIELNQRYSEIIDYLSQFPNANGELAMFYRLVGNGAYWNKNYSIAIPYYEKYLETKVSDDGLSSIEIPNMLSVCYILEDIPSKAEKILHETIQKYGSQLDENPEIKCQLYHNYGRSLMLIGKKKKAIPFFEESLTVFRNITGENNPKTSQYLDECKD